MYRIALVALVLAGCGSDTTGPPVPTSIDIEIVEQVPDSTCTVWRFSAGEPATCTHWRHDS